MADGGDEFSSFQGIHVRIDYQFFYKRIHISNSYKTYYHQIWQAGTSTGFNWNETNQAGALDVILSR